MKVKAYDDQGNPVYDKQGELVCEAPAPSMPLYFWNDQDMKKYRSGLLLRISEHMETRGLCGDIQRHKGNYLLRSL